MEIRIALRYLILSTLLLISGCATLVDSFLEWKPTAMEQYIAMQK